MRVNKEDFFIRSIRRGGMKLPEAVFDDGAHIGEWVYSKDAFIEDSHFSLRWMTPRQAAIKAMLVNISDAVAMNAIPCYALLSVGMPSSFSRGDMKELASGFTSISQKYGIAIIGGDTVKSSKLSFSVTLISRAGNPTVYRRGIKQGHLLAYTGNPGGVLKDLRRALRYHKADSHSRLIYPELRGAFFYEAARDVSAAMDISDGIFFELERLSHLNRVGFDMDICIPKQIGCSGEEFEMLIAFPQNKADKLLSLADRHRISLTIFARAVRGRFVCRCKGHHF